MECATTSDRCAVGQVPHDARGWLVRAVRAGLTCGGTESCREALDGLGLKRYCCRRMVLTHVDLIEKLLCVAADSILTDRTGTITVRDERYVKRLTRAAYDKRNQDLERS